TAALHISLILAGVTTGDYVIVPNVTFVASVNSIKYASADPIFVDIDSNNWQMDLDLLEDFLQNNTKQKNNSCFHSATGRVIRAIMPVHILGNMIDMERLIKLAKKHKLIIIEDATEALGSYYKKKHAGTFGFSGALSFNGNKIITTGGGGMILTDNKNIARKAKHLTTQAKSDPFEYIHDEVGYNYRLVNVLAAMGVAQLEKLPSFLERKKEIAALYKRELADIEGIVFQETGKHVVQNNWLITVKCKKQKTLITHLLKQDIQVRPFWRPMNQLTMFKKDLYITNANISKEIYVNCLSLPSSSGITNKELNTVVNAIKSFYK
ncbi:MAG: aminotransferase class I/II-fold pyridoxal phosphate-dependent enzyme, partial [Bacteroidia bacterium]